MTNREDEYDYLFKGKRPLTCSLLALFSRHL